MIRKSWRPVLLRVLLGFPALVYVSLILMIGSLKETLVYPGASMYKHLREDGPLFQEAVRSAGVEIWESHDGSYLGLKKRVAQPEMRWLVFYGNGDVAVRATGWFEALQRLIGDGRSDYYVLEYPGYGPQAGSPGEGAVVELAKQAVEAIPEDGLPLYLLGQSMGAGVCCRLVCEPEWKNRVRGLLLVNPYTSLVDAAHQYLSRLVGPLHVLFPVEIMLGEKYESIRNIRSFRGPVGIVAGEEDTLTPAWMAKALGSQVNGPVKIWVQPGVGHWTVPEPVSKWREVMRCVTGENRVSESGTQK